MSLNLGDNFNYQGKKPNFERDCFDTLERMKSFPETSIDEGHISLCLEDMSRYQYSSRNSISPTTGKWVRIIDNTLNDSSENPVQNKVIQAKFKEQSVQFNNKVLETENKITQAVTSLTQLIETNKDLSSQEVKELSNTLSESLKTISAALQDLKLNKLDGDVTINGKDLTSGNVDITKEDIGLGNVDNTSDLEKPLSRRATAALDSKVDKILGSRLINEAEVKKLSEIPTKQEINDLLGNKVPLERTIAGKSLKNDIVLNSSDVGLGNVDNTTDINKPVSRQTKEELDKKVDKVPGSGLMSNEEKNKLNNLPSAVEIQNHFGDIDNPHSVTKTQIGLSNVDNTSDLEKPVSKFTQAELNKKADKRITINGHTLDNDVNLLKGDVGLGNVDNTADLEKPISTATLNELNLIKRVTSEALAEIVNKIDEMSMIITLVLNDMNSRLVSLGK